MKIEERLALAKHIPDKVSHLEIISVETCRHCAKKPCLTFCPATVYHWDDGEEQITVAYEGCFECGACRLVCPHDNIAWAWPRGGFGVAYRYG